MNRAILSAGVTVVIVVLTVASYFVASSRLESKIKADLRDRAVKAQKLMVRTSLLQAIGLLSRVRAVAGNGEFVRVIQSDNRSERSTIANLAFQEFKNSLRPGEPKPDIMVLMDKDGSVVAEFDVANPLPTKWKDDKGKLRYKAIELALDQKRRQSTSEVWLDKNVGMLQVGIAPIIDPGGGDNAVIGALVIAYPITHKEARTNGEGLSGDVGYFYGGQVFATSFLKGDKEDQKKRGTLAKPLVGKGLNTSALKLGYADKVVEISLDGEKYMATAARLRRAAASTGKKPFPDDYPAEQAGAVVLMSVSKASSAVGATKTMILLLGAGALVLALLGMTLTSKRILFQADQIESGVNEIINGNLEKTFNPVGNELDGLANSLNVMLARLLGRPEPGEEEYDEFGNVVQPSALHFDTEDLSAADAEIVQLAQEPESDYYNRIYKEYVAAREESGESNDGINFESFVAKLRLNEGNLKAKYQSRAVRFKVVSKGGKVSLKPIPIV